MPPFLVRWIATALAIGVTAQVLPGIQVDGLWPTVVAALLLGLANVTIRPILLLPDVSPHDCHPGSLRTGRESRFAGLALVASVVKGVHPRVHGAVTA